MKQYILLTNAYLPKPGATGVCVHQIAKELAAQGECVTVICYGAATAKDGLIDGINVVRIKEPFYIKSYQGNSSAAALFYRLSELISKAIYFYKYPFRSILLVKNYLKAISKVSRNDFQNVIIASYTPLEGVVAAARYKEIHPETSIIYYSTDTLSNEQGNSGFLSPKTREKLGYKWEQKLFSVYDRVIIMECHKDYYDSEKYSMFFPKFRYANFPLIVKPDQTIDIVIKKSRKSIVFAGNLYKKMRNPSFTCRLFIEAFDPSKLKVTFIGGGDCVDELKCFCENSHGLISYDGFKPHDYVNRILQEADFLLSIGNSFSMMSPSKIYEYMSTGKPIIHIYSYDKDPCIAPLNRYGNAILINEGEKNSVEKLISFINNAEVLPFAVVQEMFRTSTPNYTVQLINE